MKKSHAKVVSWLVGLASMSVLPVYLESKLRVDQDTAIFVSLLMLVLATIGVGLLNESKREAPNLRGIAELAILGPIGLGMAVYEWLTGEDMDGRP